jgi:hypothetical protein
MKNKLLIRAAVILGVCMATLLVATPAMAIWDWCDVDPVLSIDGHNVSLQAAIQGDPQQMHGKIAFRVSVPEGTEVSVISCEPNARVIIKYDKSKSGVDDDHSIPVEVSVDIKTKTTFNSRLGVSLDGEQISQEQGNTDSELVSSFIIE